MMGNTETLFSSGLFPKKLILREIIHEPQLPHR